MPSGPVTRHCERSRSVTKREVVPAQNSLLRLSFEVRHRLRQIPDQDIRATEGLMNAYFSERQADKALQLLRNDLKKSPNSTVIRGLLASAAISAGNFALEQLQILLPGATNSSGILTRIAVVYRQKGDIERAIATLRQAVQADPKNWGALLFLSRVLGDNGQMGEAQQGFRHVLALQPENADAMNNLAYVLSESGGDLDEALRLVRRALQKSPNEPEFTDTMGCIYLRKKMSATAVQTFNVAVQRRPDNATYRYHLGWALMEKGDKASAKDELQKALTRRPSLSERASISELLGKIG